MKKILSIIGILALMGLGSAAYIYSLLFSSPFQHTETAYVYIDKDDTADSIRNKVQTAGQAKSMNGYDLMSKLKKYGDKHRTGRYAIKPGACMYNLVREMNNGIQVPTKIIIPTARTVEKVTGVIARSLMMDSVSLASTLKEQMETLGYTKETLPALFIPDTYEVYWDITPENLLARLQKEHEKFWNAERTAKAKQAGFTPNEIATLASIVESETNYEPEKATVAGLYINRVHKGMLLQSDPTVKFALQKFELRRILFEHLAVDSPYNTYKYAGLPPGPICIPSKKGLDAVLNYEHHDYLYMCAKEDFSGSHNFAIGLAEHMQNARKYQQALNARGIK